MPRKKQKPTKSGKADQAFIPPPAPASAPARPRPELETRFVVRDDESMDTDGTVIERTYRRAETFEEALLIARTLALSEEFGLKVTLRTKAGGDAAELDASAFGRSQMAKTGKGRKGAESSAALSVFYVDARPTTETPPPIDTSKSLYRRNHELWDQVPRPLVPLVSPSPPAIAIQPRTPSPIFRITTPIPPRAPAAKHTRTRSPLNIAPSPKRRRVDTPPNPNAPCPSPAIAVIELDDSSDEEVVLPPVPSRVSQSAAPRASQGVAIKIDEADDEADSDVEVVKQIAPRPRAAQPESWNLAAKAIDGDDLEGPPLDLQDWWQDSKRATKDKLAGCICYPLAIDGVSNESPKPGDVIIILDQLVVHALCSPTTASRTFELAIASTGTSGLSACRYLGRYKHIHQRTLTWAEYSALAPSQRYALVRGLTSSESWRDLRHLPSVARVPRTALEGGLAGLRWLRRIWGANPPLEPNGYLASVEHVDFNDLRFRFATVEGVEQALRDGYLDNLKLVVARCVGFDRPALDEALVEDQIALGHPISPQRRKLRAGHLGDRLSSSLQQQS